MSISGELTALLQTCKNEPTDNQPRWVLADWLEEHGEPDRAEFIRLQLREKPPTGEWFAEAAALRAREQRLLRRHASAWLGAVWQHNTWCRFLDGPDSRQQEDAWRGRLQRGLIEFQADAEQLLALARTPLPANVQPWLEAVAIQGSPPEDTVRELFRGPQLDAFTDVCLTWDRPDPAGVVRFLERGHVRALRLGMDRPGNEFLRALAGLNGVPLHILELGLDRGSVEGWEALTASPVLAELRDLTCQLPRRTQALALLARSPYLERLTRLNLFCDGLAVRPMRTLLGSSHLAGLVELGICGYSGTGNPAVASSLAASGSLRRLERLDLGHNPIKDKEAAALGRSPVLSTVRSLQLNSCRLSPAGACSLAASPHLGALETLSLSCTSAGDEAVIALAGSPHLGNLRRLDLCRCQVTAAGVRALAESPHLGRLEELDLSLNPLDQEALGILAASFPPGKLRSLELRRLPITGTGFQSLVQSPVVSRLVKLDLQGTPLSPSEAAALAASSHLTQLQKLSLGGNGLGPAGMTAMCEARWLDGLLDLYLSGNGIGDEGVRALVRRLPRSRLAWIDLGENDIGTEGAEALLNWAGLQHLLELNLYNNRVGEELENQLKRVVCDSNHTGFEE